MMELIERYVYTATRRLPEGQREDVAKELRANLYDMLPEDFDEADVRRILREMGNPVELGSQYREGVRHLIGPQVYEAYLAVLRVVLAVFACSAPVIALLGLFSAQAPVMSWALAGKAIGEMLAYAVQGAVQAFAWVTLIFAVIERSGAKHMHWPFTGREWTVEDLERPEKHGANLIPKSEPISSLVGILLGLMFFLFFSSYIAFVRADAGRWVVVPVFEEAVLGAYVPFVVLLAMLGTASAVLKLVHGKWTRPVAVLSSVYDLLGMVLAAAFFLNPAIIQPDFIQSMADIMSMDGQRLAQLCELGRWGLTALILGLGVWELARVYRRLRRNGVL